MSVNFLIYFLFCHLPFLAGFLLFSTHHLGLTSKRATASYSYEGLVAAAINKWSSIRDVLDSVCCVFWQMKVEFEDSAKWSDSVIKFLMTSQNMMKPRKLILSTKEIVFQKYCNKTTVHFKLGSKYFCVYVCVCVWVCVRERDSIENKWNVE